MRHFLLSKSKLFSVCFLKEFMKKLEEKRVALNKATSMGEAILTICHPDSITTIKHWNTIIKARFEEVSQQLHVCLLYHTRSYDRAQIHNSYVNLQTIQ